MDTYYHNEDYRLRERGTMRTFTSKEFAGCPSSGSRDSIRSDSAEEYLPVVGSFPVNRRKRKMLQPKRAAMYGSEAAGGWCDGTDESQCNKPRPVKQHMEKPHTPVITPRPVSAAVKPAPAPAANKSTRPQGSAAAKCSRKSSTQVCGPCANCGTTTSPQWRRGNNEKPTVCNACGIRYQRTGSFAMQLEKKRAASNGSGAVLGGAHPAKNSRTGTQQTSSQDHSKKKRAASTDSGAVSGGAHPAKRYKTDSPTTSSADTCPTNNNPEAVSHPAGGAINDRRKRRDKRPTNNSPEAVSRPAGGATTDSKKRQKFSPSDTAVSNAASTATSPAVSPAAADTLSIPASPLWLDARGANNAAVSSAYTAHHHTHAGQQRAPKNRGRRSQSGSRLGPSPHWRTNMPAEPPASDAPARQPTAHSATAAPVPSGQVISNTTPFSALPAVPLGSIPSTAVPSGPIEYAAAGTAAAQAVLQPGQVETLQLLSILAQRMGSTNAAIVYLMASAEAMATCGIVVSVAGVPGQVPAHNQW